VRATLFLKQLFTKRLSISVYIRAISNESVFDQRIRFLFISWQKLYIFFAYCFVILSRSLSFMQSIKSISLCGSRTAGYISSSISFLSKLLNTVDTWTKAYWKIKLNALTKNELKYCFKNLPPNASIGDRERPLFEDLWHSNQLPPSGRHRIWSWLPNETQPLRCHLAFANQQVRAQVQAMKCLH